MEQLNYAKESEDTFILSVFYNYGLYELRVTDKSLTSSIFDIEHLDEVIQQGLRPTQLKKLDENLKVTTHVQENVSAETLTIAIAIVYRRGKLKAFNEKHNLVLKQKKIDTQKTFENVMRDTERTLNLPHIQPATTNLFVTIELLTKTVFYRDENGTTIMLIKSNEFYPLFLQFLEEKDKEVKKFYENKQKSQDSIVSYNMSLINGYFENYSIYSIIANYFSYTYFCNFFSIVNNGQMILVNVSLNKQPKEGVYHVTKSLLSFSFDSKLHYRILCEFSVRPDEGVQSSSELAKEVEISYDRNWGYRWYESRKLAKNKYIYVAEGKYYIKTNANGQAEKFVGTDKATVYNGDNNVIKSPSKMLRLTTNGQGCLAGIYVHHCGDHLSCNCENLSNSLKISKVLFQEPDEEDADAGSHHVYLVEQF
jgi:hypothetical protein